MWIQYRKDGVDCLLNMDNVTEFFHSIKEGKNKSIRFWSNPAMGGMQENEILKLEFGTSDEARFWFNQITSELTTGRKVLYIDYGFK